MSGEGGTPQQQVCQQVTQALQALYYQTNPSQREAAHQWLLAFQHSTDAWEVSFLLLAHQVCCINQTK